MISFLSLCHTPKYVVYAEIFKIKLEGLGVRGEGGREGGRSGGGGAIKFG